MDLQFTTPGALIGLIVAILLIIEKVQPAYDLILGTLIGGLTGSGSLAGTISTMVNGTGSMTSSMSRILTSGILADTLIKTGVAQKIAETIVDTIGEKRAITTLAAATMVICVVDVFTDVVVITATPVALAIGERAGLSKSGILFAVIGGGRAGNIVPSNLGTIVVTEVFKLDFVTVVIKNPTLALYASIATIVLASLLTKKAGDGISQNDLEAAPAGKLPNALQAFAGPLTVIVLLALRLLARISVDPLIAFPLGGPACILVTGNARNLIPYMDLGLSKVIGVTILLIGTSAIAGIIKASALQKDMTALLSTMNMSAFILALLSGILMTTVTTSTTAGSTVASQTLSGALLFANVPILPVAVMIHIDATVLDSLPHDSFFHATGGLVYMDIKNRMKLIPFEALIGLTSTIVAVILYLVAA